MDAEKATERGGVLLSAAPEAPEAAACPQQNLRSGTIPVASSRPEGVLGQENEGELDMFDLELQKEFADASSRQQASPWTPTAPVGTLQPLSSRLHRSEEVAVLGTQISSVAEELKISEVSRDPESTLQLITELASVVRRHCQQRRGGSKPPSSPSVRVGTGEFEEDFTLVSTVLEEVYHAHCGVSALPNEGGGAITVSLLQKHNERMSFPGHVSRHPKLYGSPNHVPGHRSFSNGRNTIDTEVSDSLYRLQVSAPVPSYARTEPEHRFLRRPFNPYSGCAHGSFTTPGQAPQTEMPETLREAKAAPLPVPLPSPVVPFEVATAAEVPPKVECPRPVKPTHVKSAQHSSRGPRNETGKNICPSNCSAFSECSGGESRSFHSTELAAKALGTRAVAEVVAVCV